MRYPGKKPDSCEKVLAMQERPGSVTMIGILTIIVASLGLLLYCMCSIRVLVLLTPEAKVADLRSISGFVPMAVITFILNMVLSSLFLTGGIGLLLMGQWARVLTLICAFMNLATHLGTIIYTFVVVRPALARLPVNLHRELGPLFGDQNEVLMPIAIGALEILFSIVAIVILFLPSVGAAFVNAARYASRGRYGRDDYRPSPRRNDEDW
jgi:hypothetical protein